MIMIIMMVVMVMVGQYDHKTYNVDWLTASPGRLHKCSTKLPGSHLGPCGPAPGRETPNGLHRGSRRPSEALWARTGPEGPKHAPQSLLEAIWAIMGPNRAGRLQTVSTEAPGGCLGILGFNRAGRPQTGSTESPGGHLGQCGPQPDNCGASRPATRGSK
jgi:hypothetical protein